MKKYTFFYGAIFFFVLLVDRLTKYGALIYLQEKPYRINQFLSFDLAFNRGISWSLFHSANTAIFVAVTILIAAIIVVLGMYTWRRYTQGYLVFAQTVILAGAMSNLIDRLYYHAVIDFISISFSGWSWPIFNGADIAIVLGIGYMLIMNRTLL